MMLFATLVVTSCLAQADTHLDASISAWTERYEQYSAVEFIAEGHVVTTPHFIDGLGIPTQDLPDRPLPMKLHVKFDFKNKRLWMRQEGFQWDVPKKGFRKRITELTCIREKARLLKIFPDSDETFDRVYEDNSRVVHRTRRIDMLPIWFNSGIVTVDGTPKSLFDLPDYASLRDAFHWSIVPDNNTKADGVVRLVLSGKGSSSYVVRVDSRNQYRVASVENRDGRGKLLTQTHLSYGESKERKVPHRWTVSAFEADSGELIIHYEVRVTRFKKHSEFPAETFVLTDG